MLVVASSSHFLHHSRISSDWDPQILLQPLWCKNRVEAPIKQLTMLGEAGCPPWVFFSHWRNQRLREDLCDAAEEVGGAMWSNVVTSLTPLMQSV